MNLLIVESPAKSKTIKRFLGKDFQVAATLGHIRDLPSKKLGVDIEDNFKPEYIAIPGKKKVIKELKKQSKKVKKVWLAMDLDREGEAIAWHTAQALNLENNYERIVFNEITKNAIQKALKSPRKINQDLVDAQQARRILDRIVGYKLSPLLWKKISRGLSAGRVQSIALWLIAEREKEIERFIPQEYWTIIATLSKVGAAKIKVKPSKFEAMLSKKDGKAISRLGIKNKTEADRILKDLEKTQYQVSDIEKEERKRNPFPPFITSTLQQEAWKRFHWPAKSTMMTAQKLYEMGFISYHRSDSFNLSNEALEKAQQIIVNDLGSDYYPGAPRRFKTKSKSAQEAHEAVRPTHPEKRPDNLRSDLDQFQFKLYDLIWRRFIACQMNPAIFDTVKMEINAGKYSFSASGQTLEFDGFLRMYPLKYEESELPLLKKNEALKLKKLMPTQHFTKPLPRYTEATLIKELEKNGIGRPSTYAPIISVIQKRNYVKKNKDKRFYPSEIGVLVNELLIKHFPKIVDIGFTAEMEEDLDKIASGRKEWRKVLEDFYKPFAMNLKNKYQEIEKHVEQTDEKCPECGAPLLIRMGRFGRFYGCSKFPKCKFTKPCKTETLGIKCPKCKKGDIVEKRTRKAKIFYGCNRWPDCDFALWNKPTGDTCPECGALLVEDNRGKTMCSNKNCGKSV